MLRKNWVFWLNSTLLHGIVIVLLWFPQPLHFPTRADVMDAWKNAALYFERTLHPEQFARAEQEAKAAAQQRIAQLPPALITRAKPLNKVIQIRCPKDARMAKRAQFYQSTLCACNRCDAKTRARSNSFQLAIRLPQIS